MVPFHRSIRASLNLRFDKRELEAEAALRRAAKEQLFMEKDRLQTTLSEIDEGVAMADANGHIEYLNPDAEALCGCPANGEDVETLLGHADHAMYRAKQRGRDQG